MLKSLKTKEDLINFFRREANPITGNLSINGVAKLAEVEDTSIIRGSAFGSNKLAKKLAPYGVDPSALVRDGIPPRIVILILEYFAYESKVKSEQARRLILTFSTVGLLEGLEQVVIKPASQIDYASAVQMSYNNMQAAQAMMQTVQAVFGGVSANKIAIEDTNKRVDEASNKADKAHQQASEANKNVQNLNEKINGPAGYEAVHQHVATLPARFSTTNGNGATTIIGNYLKRNGYPKHPTIKVRNLSGHEVCCWEANAISDAITHLINDGDLIAYKPVKGITQVKTAKEVAGAKRVKKQYTSEEALELLYPYIPDAPQELINRTSRNPMTDPYEHLEFIFN